MNIEENLLNKEIKIVGLSWNADWVGDRPCLILEPFIRFGYNDLPGLIENLVVDICMALEYNTSVREDDISLEFQWRGWKLDSFRQAAQAIRNRECMNLKRGFTLLEKTYKFIKLNNNDKYIKIVEVK